ncbi:hypothetical protein AUP07_0495 [methanogenic archaeon mixed culture ISO4-G1]|nr:hypothetical protein AUP07_0495 [methanogenic archaeon mixed culture ISO4-G1]
MDTRKMTLFATIAAIALLAVGIGYAYTASTSNSGNSASLEYYLIGQYAEDGQSHAIISATANDYREDFTKGINYSTDNVAGTISYTLNGTEITALGKTVSLIGTTKLVAFDQDGSIDSPGVQGKTHAKLKIEIASPAQAHTVNDNFTLIAKLGTEFAAVDVANQEAATSVFSGYSVLTLTDNVYSGYLYVPLASLSTGFDVCLGAYFSGLDPTVIDDTDMAYATVDGDKDENLLYNATVKFSIDSTAWVAAA